jgi:hypothetical protein
MTNLQLIAEVRRFFPHARTDGRDVPFAKHFGLGSRLRLYVYDQGLEQCVRAYIKTERGRVLRFARGMSVAEALRALGFGERVPAWRKPMWLQLKMLRDGRNACPLQSRQRPRKGARLGARARIEAKP